MTDQDLRDHCAGCFAPRELNTAAEPCPRCGFDPHTERPANALPPGTLLAGQFVVGRVLGKPGGFGITYLGLDRHLQMRVAIKEYLPRDLAMRAADGGTIMAHTVEEQTLFGFGLEQFMTEARTLAQLDHPNIVRVRQFFEANGSAYLVMDYYEGVSLAEHLAGQPGGRMAEAPALALIQPVLDGLRAVHAKGFLHRDIKPANIYLALSESGGVRPILLDFGAARQAMGERSRSLSVVVSDGYAPFEQYHRKGRQGPWTDIYAAAAVLYRALTGQVPPPASERMAEDELKPAASFGVSAPVSKALARALAMQTQARPQTVTEFQQQLRGLPPAEDWIELPFPPPRRPVRRVADPAPPPHAKPTARAAAKPGPRRAPWLAALPLLAAALAVAVLIGLQPRDDARRTPVAASAGNVAPPVGDGNPAAASARPAPANEPAELAALRRRAEAGDAQAQNDLGVRYGSGDGVPRSDAEAVLWYRRAAEQGNSTAQFNLALMYADGRGGRARRRRRRTPVSRLRRTGGRGRAEQPRLDVRLWPRRGTGPRAGGSLVPPRRRPGRSRRLDQPGVPVRERTRRARGRDRGL
jgi:serine/threonine protein kinase